MNAKALHYSSYMPVLLRALAVTTGPVLELGMGRFSTPLLHWACDGQRSLVSCDYDPKWVAWGEQWRTEHHQVWQADDWDALPIEQPPDVALVDHSPAARRKVEVRRLAPWVTFLVVHDTDGRNEKHYDYRSVWPLFRFRYTFPARPRTTVVSNLIDVASVMSW